MRAAFWFIACVVALGACGSRAPANGGSAEPSADDWVCKPADQGWQCDQGAEPRPAAAPGPSADDLDGDRPGAAG